MGSLQCFLKKPFRIYFSQEDHKQGFTCETAITILLLSMSYSKELSSPPLFLDALPSADVSPVFQILLCQGEEFTSDSEIAFTGIHKRKHLSLSNSRRRQLHKNVPTSSTAFSFVLSYCVNGLSLLFLLFFSSYPFPPALGMRQAERG